MKMKTNDELIQDYIKLDATIARLQQNKDLIEMALRKRMDDDGATIIPHATHQVELKTTLAYDHAKLTLLHEVIDPAELVSSGAFIPEHEEPKTIPDKWNMVKVKPFAKYGDNIKDIIDAAAYPSKVVFSVTEK